MKLKNVVFSVHSYSDVDQLRTHIGHIMTPSYCHYSHAQTSN